MEKRVTTGKVSTHQRVLQRKNVCYLFTSIFKATARINTAVNKKTNTRRSCRSLCFNCSRYFLKKNIVLVSATVRPILQVEKIRVIWPCF